MRRTRHVVLPVKSWQYVGLMVVSLACLTLGLVSRDREGKSGSLTSPELMHTAPHEVDACPNDNPFAPGSTTADDSLPPAGPISSETLLNSRNRVSRSRSVSPDRRATRNLQIRTTERRTRDSRDVRALENQRLTRLMERRSVDTRRDSRSRSLERRSVDRRVPDITRSRSATARERSLDDVRAERRSNERRETRNIHSNERFANERREIRSFERLQNDRLGARRVNVRTLDRKSMERREVRDVERRVRQTERIERIRDDRRDVRRSNIRSMERSAAERREIRLIERSANRMELPKAQLNNRRQVSRDDNRERRSRIARSYLTLPEFSPKDNGSYEFIKQALILTLCAGYTASLFQTKTRNFRNMLPRFDGLLAY